MTRQNNNASQIIIIMTKQIFWKLACISLAMINLISLVIWFYLKLSGETNNFCFYDCNPFLIYYLLFLLYSIAIIGYPSITVIFLLNSLI